MKTATLIIGTVCSFIAMASIFPISIGIKTLTDFKAPSSPSDKPIDDDRLPIQPETKPEVPPTSPDEAPPVEIPQEPPIPIDKYTNLDFVFLNSVKNTSDDNYLHVDSKITFRQHVKKTLVTLGIPTDVKEWDLYKDYNYTNQINIDLFNNQFILNAFPSTFQYVFYDPEPSWHDPVGARWNNKEQTITVQAPTTIKTPIQRNKDWFGENLEATISLDAKTYDDGVTVTYPPHSYWVYGVAMVSYGDYKVAQINKNVKVKRITNENIVSGFLSKNGIKFNDNMTNLITLYAASYAINFLEDFIEKYTVKGVWLNNYISEYEVYKNINSLKTNHYNDFSQIKELILSYQKNQSYILDGNFEQRLDELNNGLKETQIIDNYHYIDHTNVQQFYETVVLFYKHNNIFLNTPNKKIQVWNGNNFMNMDYFNQMKRDEVKSISIERHSNTSSSQVINDNFDIILN